MSKRARTNNSQPQRRAKRPIDKKFANLELAAQGNVQGNLDVTAAMSYPGTVTGLRWNLNVQRVAGAAALGTFKWAIVVVPQNTNQSALNLGTGASLYDPEQNVLAFGTGCSNQVGDDPVVFIGDTSTMRKLKAGDRIGFCIQGNSAVSTHAVSGTVMLFIKS